ncbi:uncharacterized protein LOC62_01G000337 [Vanrija pseudolonga]|uniref:Ribosome biogenesis protein SLX9 n=1 Tax=Vanrija pseudolonga TaxID=143232 RepID=A0AAF0Y255_9TREE|nr:hypothetical protein LOC62_01G000337 [Vanrija pseudolonga]
MPRAERTKATRRHGAAAPLTKRALVADGAVEHVLPGSNPAAEIPDLAPSKPEPTSKPFHGAVLAGAAAPYSKSHARREKRKAAQQLGSGLGSVAAALFEAAGEVPVPTAPVATSRGKKRAEVVEVPPQLRKREADGKIGEGSAKTMGERRRRKQISAAAQRIPAVMAHPSFKASPWATIREHAANSLAAAEASTSLAQRKDTSGAARAQKAAAYAASSGGAMVGVE